MDRPDDGLLRIGVFSTLSRISVRMLRHYQEHGLLEPVVVEPFSGYRYYAPAQLDEARRVVLLRDAGFSIEATARLLDVAGDPSRVEAAIAAHRLELQADRDQVDARILALDRVGPALEEMVSMTENIEVRTTHLPETTLATLRRRLPTYADEGLLWQEIMPLVGRSGAPFAPGGVAGATFYDEGFRESDVDVEVWVEVTGPFDPVAPLGCRVQPARDVVTATLLGGYEQMTGVMGALGAYVAEHGLTTGEMFNIYRVGPAQDPDPSAWVTEVCLAVVPS